MARSTSIQLNERWDKFLSERIAAGRFDSVSEAVREGLRLLEEQEDKFETLKAALDDGLASGDAGPLDMEEIIREARTLAQRAARDTQTVAGARGPDRNLILHK